MGTDWDIKRNVIKAGFGRQWRGKFVTFLFVSALLKQPTKTYRSASHSRSPFQHCNSLKKRRAKKTLTLNSLIQILKDLNSSKKTPFPAFSKPVLFRRVAQKDESRLKKWKILWGNGQLEASSSDGLNPTAYSQIPLLDPDAMRLPLPWRQALH